MNVNSCRMKMTCFGLIVLFSYSSVKELKKSIPDIEEQLSRAKTDHAKAKAAEEQVMEKVNISHFVFFISLVKTYISPNTVTSPLRSFSSHL